MSIATSQLVRLTTAKAASNTNLRWVPFFLPTLALAFDASTATLATIVGFGEMAGLSTLLIAKRLGDGRGRLIVAFAMIASAAAAAVALLGSLAAFAVSFVVVVASTAFVTVGGHTWISGRVPFALRARYIGIFEISWALALLLGAPIAALLIDQFGWRGPYVALVLVCSVLGLVVFAMTDPPPIAEPATAAAEVSDTHVPLGANAWITIGAAACIAMAGLTMIVIVGTWLDDELGVSTGGVGLVAMSFGLAELTASSSSASFADRIGKQRSTQGALMVMLVGLAIVAVANGSLLVAVVGLLLMFLGFEYAIVTSFSLISESVPHARGRALATGSAVGTLARGIGAGSAGVLYDAIGIRGPTAVAAVAAVIAIVLLHRASVPGEEPLSRRTFVRA